MSTIETEIIVIGGGAAGLAAALTLARARRGVIVLDSGEPRNALALGAHGVRGQEGIGLFDLLRKGREEVTLDALVVPTSTTARLDGLERLEVEVSESPTGTAVTVDTAGHTSVPGVWAAGNLAQPATQVIEAAADGTRVARNINTELIFRDADRAVTETENNR